MKLRSEGDEKDVYNDDFVLPKDNNWATESKEKQTPDGEETIFILESQALLVGETIFYPKDKGPSPQRHPINVKKIDHFFSNKELYQQKS